jgi:integrase
MPHLIRRSYTKIDPETGEKTIRQTRKWYGQYRDTNGVLQRVPLCADKTAAKALLLDMIRDTERRLAGLIDPAADQLSRPLSEHIEEYRTHLVAKARSEKHIGETIRVIKHVVEQCRYRILADLHVGGDRLEEYLADRRGEGSAHRTVNADLVAVRSFCRWLMDKGRMKDDPTRGLHRLNVEEDRRRERRALTHEEAQRLIDAAFRSTRKFRHLSGKDRAVMYTLAQRTGLRRKELRSLTPRSFDLKGTPPMVQLEARSSKRRRRDLLPLPADVAKTMREYLADRPPDKRVWPGSWWHRSAEMLRLDLLDAEIESEDAQGRVVDFHGQRTTFITALARAGVTPATAQKLARHSDINLTLGTYTRLGVEDLVDAVEMLPELHPSAAKSSSNPEPQPEMTEPADPQLAGIVAAWPDLPEHIHQAILALVGIAASSKSEGSNDRS